MKEPVIIREVGLREGVQSLTQILSVEERLALVTLLNTTGIREIELAALVRADRVPQWKDADELIARYPRIPGVEYTALYLNKIGFERGEQSGRLDNRGWVYASASEAFFQSNYNRTLESFLTGLPEWQQTFAAAGKSLHGLMISCAFGFHNEGLFHAADVFKKIVRILEALDHEGVAPTEVSLADTVGMATPQAVRDLVGMLRAFAPAIAVSLHLHDTRGLGIANILAGLSAGVRIFEGSLGGIGGCPFAPGASGNIATEEIVYLCEAEGFATGINLDAYMTTIDRLVDCIGPAQVPGKLYRALGGSSHGGQSKG